ncbi:hypothetical protein OG216_08690 [Streptomycetaceae bacterium NBC_01309]
MNTPTTHPVPVPLHHRARAALRARDEAAARAERDAREGRLPADAYRAAHLARVTLAALLGVYERDVVAMLGPRGTLVLTVTVTDPPGTGTLAFLAERTHPVPVPGHPAPGDAPAFRFQALDACPGCKRLMPQREIRELADLGSFLDPRDPDEYAHLGIDASQPGALDPEWHGDRCGFLLACSGPLPRR